MTPESNLPTTAAPSIQQCRSCGAGASLREHFCPQCEHILTLSRHGDYFTFFGITRSLGVDAADLERRYRDMSRQFHPDYFYNAAPAARLASLERSSYLNDAYRVLRQPVARMEYLLGLEGLPVSTGDASGARVPASLLEEVFELNEELDDIREQRTAGAPRDGLVARLTAVRAHIEAKREAHDAELQELSAQWDVRKERVLLERLRERLVERHYIRNLLDTVDAEKDGLASHG